jgi:serine/threonine protein kinase
LSTERLDEEATYLGSYAVIRKLARGGMAELFLALGPSGLVVLKKILPKYIRSRRYKQLFLDEARLATSLDHPNIVHAFGAGQAQGEASFAMEFLHGQDVRTILHRAWTLREKVPIEHAVHIVSKVASALHYAHEQRRPDGTLLQIVHRDVSPSNIIVSYDGDVKLLDFGVAKAATSSVKTRTGTLKGKISYMSPEQARGAAIDRRSDVFSLGIVLWELVTTQRLFRGENDLQTLQLIINQPPRRPSELQPACEPELERIIMRALAQDPAARYQTAAELLADLEEIACVQGFDSDPAGLSSLLGQLFSQEVRAWEEAKAAGRTLADHLMNSAERTIQLTESDFVEALDLDAMLAGEGSDEEIDDEDDDADDDEDEELTEVPGPIPVPTGSHPSQRIELGDSRALAPSDPLLTRPGTPVAMASASSGSIPVARPRMPTPSAPIPVARPYLSTPSGPIPVARPHTPSGPIPVAQPHVPMPTPPPSPVAGTPSAPMPIAISPPIPTPAGSFAAAPAPPGALHPQQADRLVRRTLWVGVGILGVIIVVAIAVGLASSGPSVAGPAGAPGRPAASSPQRGS